MLMAGLGHQARERPVFDDLSSEHDGKVSFHAPHEREVMAHQHEREPEALLQRQDQLDDLRRWSGWSPWERLDLTMERTYDGPPRGVGATYAWRGNGDVGAGRMEIVESRPSEKLRVRLEFLEPFEATNMATFTLAPRGDGTEVVWAMDGDNSFIGKVVSVFMDMDALIGQDFERGLESLREVSVTSGT